MCHRRVAAWVIRLFSRSSPWRVTRLRLRLCLHIHLEESLHAKGALDSINYTFCRFIVRHDRVAHSHLVDHGSELLLTGRGRNQINEDVGYVLRILDRARSDRAFETLNRLLPCIDHIAIAGVPAVIARQQQPVHEVRGERAQLDDASLDTESRMLAVRVFAECFDCPLGGVKRCIRAFCGTFASRTPLCFQGNSLGEWAVRKSLFPLKSFVPPAIYPK